MSYEPVITKYYAYQDSYKLDFFLSHGGYKQSEKAVKEMKPDEVTELIKKSNLRGRGGAGFPTGMKWSFVAKNTGKPTYLVVNADESEPGTFKDRIIIEREPHRLLEGIIIASYAIGANTAFIYIRGEYVTQHEILKTAIKEAYDNRILGSNIFGSQYSLNVILHRGAGAYICGEETALLNSLEGKRGYPRIKPPFPAVEGLFGCPTIINNVETLATVPFILEKGVEWFMSIGTAKSPGPKLFCLSGHINKPGMYEIPLGIKVIDLLNNYGGGIRNGLKVKGVVPGGSSSGVLDATELDTAMDFDSLMAKGLMLGTASVIVMDETVCMVGALWNLARFYHHESCGQCTPCREGTGWIEKLLARLEEGRGTNNDLQVMGQIAKNMCGKTICVLADALAIPVEQYLKRYLKEFEDHVKNHGCPIQ